MRCVAHCLQSPVYALIGPAAHPAHAALHPAQDRHFKHQVMLGPHVDADRRARSQVRGHVGDELLRWHARRTVRTVKIHTGITQFQLSRRRVDSTYSFA